MWRRGPELSVLLTSHLSGECFRKHRWVEGWASLSLVKMWVDAVVPCNRFPLTWKRHEKEDFAQNRSPFTVKRQILGSGCPGYLPGSAHALFHSSGSRGCCWLCCSPWRRWSRWASRSSSGRRASRTPCMPPRTPSSTSTPSPTTSNNSRYTWLWKRVLYASNIAKQLQVQQKLLSGGSDWLEHSFYRDICAPSTMAVWAKQFQERRHK